MVDMTMIDYANALNNRIYYYLKSKVQRYQMDPFIIRFSLLVMPLKKILDTPLVVQDGPKSFKKQEQMEADSNKWYLKRINKFMDILEARKCD